MPPGFEGFYRQPHRAQPCSVCCSADEEALRVIGYDAGSKSARGTLQVVGDRGSRFVTVPPDSSQSWAKCCFRCNSPKVSSTHVGAAFGVSGQKGFEGGGGFSQLFWAKVSSLHLSKAWRARSAGTSSARFLSKPGRPLNRPVLPGAGL